MRYYYDVWKIEDWGQGGSGGRGGGGKKSCVN